MTGAMPLSLLDSVRTDRPSFRRLQLDAPHLLLLREAQPSGRNAARRVPSECQSVTEAVAPVVSPDAPTVLGGR